MFSWRNMKNILFCWKKIALSRAMFSFFPKKLGTLKFEPKNVKPYFEENIRKISFVICRFWLKQANIYCTMQNQKYKFWLKCMLFSACRVKLFCVLNYFTFIYFITFFTYWNSVIFLVHSWHHFWLIDKIPKFWILKHIQHYHFKFCGKSVYFMC